jgi:hypothetical protein
LALFVVKADTSTEALEFFARTAERLEGNSLLKNPFIGKITRFSSLYVVDINPIYPNVTPFVFLSFIFVVVVWGWAWWMLSLLILSSAYFFWTKWFFYPILKRGLRKSGYSGEVKLCSNEDALKEVVTLWDNKI